MRKYTSIGFTLPTIASIKAKGPFDNRTVVETKYDLINADIWRVSGELSTDDDPNSNTTPKAKLGDKAGSLWVYNGMLVITEDTNTIYIYKGGDPDNKISNDSTFVDDTITISTTVYTRDSESDSTTGNAKYCWKNGSTKIYTESTSVKVGDTAWQDVSKTVTAGTIGAITIDNKSKFKNSASLLGPLSPEQKDIILNNLWSEYHSSSDTISEIGNKIGIIKLGTASEGYAKTYQLTYNGVGIENAIIDIPKDLVVSSGSIVSGTWNNNTFTEGDGPGKAIKLVITNQPDDPIYINVNDLVDIYTVPDYTKENTGDIIRLSLDSNNKLTASIIGTGIPKSSLDASVRGSLGKADSALQVVSISGDHITTSTSTATNSQGDQQETISVTLKESYIYDDYLADSYNATLNGAVKEGDPVPDDYKTKVGEDAEESTLNSEEAAAYNKTLDGAVKSGELSDGLVTGEVLDSYVKDAIAGADNALYSISSGNSTYISVTNKNADNTLGNADDHTQQVSANVVTLASYNANQSDGLISTSEVYNALTWN